jgi:hypothetical protein
MHGANANLFLLGGSQDGAKRVWVASRGSPHGAKQAESPSLTRKLRVRKAPLGFDCRPFTPSWRDESFPGKELGANAATSSLGPKEIVAGMA